MAKKISVVINTKNAEATLEQCLQSVSSLDPEIIVVDMHSTDKTVTIAKQYKAKVYEHKDIGYADPARNFALSKATSEWILVLDADEYIEKKFADHIKNELTAQDSYDVFSIPRKNIIFDSWIKHSGWWPDRQIRLFRNGMVSWEVGVHRPPVTKGNLDILPEREEYSICHNNYFTIESYLERLQRYTTLTAQEDGSTAEDFNKQNIALNSISIFRAEFFSRLFANYGIKDKGHGVVLALLQGFYQVSTLLKIWQKHGFDDTGYNERNVINDLSDFRRELQYWIADWHVQHSKGLKNLFWRIRRKYRW